MTNAVAQPASEPLKASLGSDPATKESGADMVTPYGTRSRNRTGTARPNYAEDKDIEMDNYDYYHDKRDHDATKKASRQPNAAANGDGVSRGGIVLRKTGGDEARASAPTTGTRDQASAGVGGGGVGASASQAPQPSSLAPSSRKRKATAAGVSTRRAGHVVPASGPTLRETNLMTFEQCSSRPVDGQMRADDGTVLEANGESSSETPFNSLLFLLLLLQLRLFLLVRDPDREHGPGSTPNRSW